MALFVILAFLLSGCNLLTHLPTQAVTPSPTVTLTPGPGALLASAAAPITPSLPSTPSLTPPPTATVFVLPPTPGRSPTAPYSTIPPHITNTPSTPDQSGNAPQIDFLIASPSEIDPGGSITLSWKAVGDAITLYALNPAGQLSSQGTNVDPEGSTTVTTDASVRNSVSYMLFATSAGKTVSASVQVVVHCPDVWFFANPPGICPNAPANASAGAYEHFEHGLMLWSKGTDLIYILYNDATSPPVSSYPNPWATGMPEFDPSIVPPSGLYQPVRGFGKVWREELAGQPVSPRSRLGWATEPESSFQTVVQCDSAYKYSSCFIQGPTGETIWLKPEHSGWQVWTGP